MLTATYEQDSDPAVPSTTGQTMLESSNISVNNSHPPRDQLVYRPNTQFARSVDMRTTQRKPTPSPLQVESAMTADSQADNSSGISRSPTASRAESVSQYSSQSSRSPHSPRSIIPADPDLPDSSQDRPGEDIVTGSLATDKATNQSGDGVVLKDNAAVPPKIQSYGQLRNVSAPFPQTRPLGDSSPHFPSSSNSPPSANSTIHPQSRSVPRTSSIDSAISTISTTTSHSHKSSQELFVSNPADISHLINTAGSAEAVIQHLLREKQHSTAQNGQLWKLVDKQRALLLGLNNDLERALKDKERYRRKLKEHLGEAPPVPSATLASEFSVASHSHTASDTHELPIQGNTRLNSGLNGLQDPSPASKLSNASQEPKGNEARSEMGEISPQVKKRSANADSTPSEKQAPDSESRAVNPSGSRRAMPPLDTAFVSSNQNTQASNTVVSPSSFTAKRSQKVGPGSSPALMVSSPPGSNNETFSTPPRKHPPAPLDLRQPVREEVHLKPEYGPEDHSGSDYDENLETDEIIPSVDRGRKKTREEDDQEREAAALKEKQDRSRSKKEKGSKTPSETSKGKASEVDLPVPTTMPPAIKAVSPPAEPAGGSSFLPQTPSLASVLTASQSQQQTKINRTFLSTQPLSPGLPVSPRPGDRPMNSPMPRMPRDGAGPSIASPPLSPRTGFVGLPLSPRAPKQLIPFPPETPMSMSAPTPRLAELPKESPDTTDISGFNFPQPVDAPTTESHPDSEPLVLREQDASRSNGVCKGFVSDTHPDLLIPPNALPSIIIKVISSRLKPSRNSYLVNKGSEEEPVFTLGVSSRSDLEELWQVEKSLISLPQLDYQLKQCAPFGAKLPDRALFSGHAPAKIDARRVALERYFETILDTPMDDNAALILCRYLSTQIVEGLTDEANDHHSASGSPVTQGPDGRLLKEGYLTKRGKRYGGWKARFFVLDEPVLRYYDSPGGPLSGTIKLSNAQIGKPLPHHSSNSPSRGEESDSHYRHAFLILEPKRNNSNNHVRHTLCAESDEERDAWVDALLYYVDDHQEDGQAKKPSVSSNESGSHRIFAPQKRPQRNDGSLTDSPQSDTFDGLQSVSYDDTVAAHPPFVDTLPDKRFAESPSPPYAGAQNFGTAQKYPTISGPSNGAKIQDVGAWGNKPLAPSQTLDKEHKKRSIWGFHNKHPLETTAYSNESTLSLTQQQYYERISNVRPAFGLSLADAVEYCHPRGVDVCLPAVVFRCLEYLKAQDAWSEEGIFRLSGSSVVIKSLRDRFNNEGDFDFLADDNYYDVHAVASLLKLYLRELPSSVLTRELHLDFLHVLGM